MADPVTVEVVLTTADGRAVRRQVALSAGITAWQAVLASGLAADYPDQVDPQRLGIFARRVAPETMLNAGDRVELYRPLQLDPKEARRRRASDR